jgi:hypothetical protein
MSLIAYLQEWIAERDRVTAEMEYHFQALCDLDAAEKAMNRKRLELMPQPPSAPLRPGNGQIPVQPGTHYALQDLLRKAEAPEMAQMRPSPPRGNGR